MCVQVGTVGVDFCHVPVELEGKGAVELQVNDKGGIGGRVGSTGPKGMGMS
jgi:hypothetical protein